MAAKNLVIVESPAKAKTIEGFLGKDYVVKSSFGHVRDLAKKELGVDIENNFEPNYDIIPDKKSVIADLKKLSKSADMVWLATDEDREGEAISWHLFEALGLKAEKTKRIVFHEITKTAITAAIKEPRAIDMKLVNAQQARRVLDRLVGFELSPVLWKKIKPSLSAGRVQSVAVRLIVEREREIEGFSSNAAYRVVVHFESDNGSFKAELPKKIATKEEAQKFLEACITASFSIASIVKKPSKRSSAAPFTTSTLQQEASRKLGFSVGQTMTVAQKLYESGKITYMRTDSVNLSNLAIGAAQKEIVSSYGEQYANPKQYVTKNKGAQEAHEAIRPTYMSNKQINGERNEERLYELIWKRTIASQMMDAQIEKTTVEVHLDNSDEKLFANGEVITFDGFLKVYIEGRDDETEEQKGMLPKLSESDSLSLENAVATERFSHHAPRFGEASLVKKLEELGIGRPSTYAPTISTIQKREYIIKEDREGSERNYTELSLENEKVVENQLIETTGREKSKLYPTDIGIVVTDFLVENFERIMDYNFTATVEKEFDEIALGQKEWNTMINSFYNPFHKVVEDTLEHSERASGERLLGVDNVSGKNVYARIGRYGSMVQLGEADDEEKPKFAGLKGDLTINNVTLEQAMELFKLPRVVGAYEGEEVTASVGRYGPYIKYQNKFISIPEEEDPLTISLTRSIELIDIKKKEDAERVIKEFKENDQVFILKGKWGPYIKIGRKNYKMPKEVEDPATLTLEECQHIADNQVKGGGKKDAPKSKTTKTKKKTTAKK